MAVFHPDFGVVLSHRFDGRVEFLKNGPMDGSISIKNVTHQDIGLYECSVQTFPRGPWTRHIQVEDLGKYDRKRQSACSELSSIIPTSPA